VGDFALVPLAASRRQAIGAADRIAEKFLLGPAKIEILPREFNVVVYCGSAYRTCVEWLLDEKCEFYFFIKTFQRSSSM